MILIKTIAQLEQFFQDSGRKGKTVGLVPTMGCLHQGHLSLIKQSKSQNDLTVVSVFVNPTQFAQGEDFESYPRDIEKDCRLAESVGADVVFNPDANEIYPSGHCTAVEVEGEITKKLCGASRPTHFKGVTTVVNILFNIVRPDNAYFGQKDAQQALIIKKMVKDLHIPVNVVVCPIIREQDGLAMSSRNLYLTPEQREQATVLNTALKEAQRYLNSDAPDNTCTHRLASLITNIIQSRNLAKIDYVQILNADTLEKINSIDQNTPALAAVAVKFGNTRLIDNIVLSVTTKE